MKFSASTVLLAAALGVSAHPHGAVHNHVHRDTNLEVRDQFVKNVKPTTTVFQTVTVPAVNAAAAPSSSSSAAVAIAAATTTSKAAATTSASSGSSGTIGSSGSYTDDFCTGTSKRGTAEQNAFSGNTGTTYGCNLKLVEESAAKNYQYISVLENAASEKQVCACFLKTGPDGTPFTGFWKGNEVLDFELAAGAKKYLAVQAESIGGCSCGVGSLPLTALGQISGVWLEWEFGSKLNPGFSGADASSLVPEENGNPIQGLTITTENPVYVSGKEKKSIIYPNGDGCNAFPWGTKADDGWGFNIANTQKGGDAIRLHAKWGTTGTLADCPNVTEGSKSWPQTRA